MEGLFVLVSFVIAFIGIAFWAYAPRNKARMKLYGDIPLREERHGG